MELGKDIDDSVIEEKIKAEKPEQCALLIYTVSDCGDLWWVGRGLKNFDSDSHSYDDDNFFLSFPLLHTPFYSPLVWYDGQPQRRHAKSR